jgi:hypothetical protein
MYSYHYKSVNKKSKRVALATKYLKNKIYYFQFRGDLFGRKYAFRKTKVAKIIPNSRLEFFYLSINSGNYKK